MKNSIFKHLFLLLTVSLVSCSKELTKEEASNILSEYFPEYCETSFVRKTAEFYAKDRLTSDKSKENLEIFKNLEKKGLLTIIEKKYPDSSIRYSYEIKDEWKEKFGKLIKPTQRNFIEVSNIYDMDGKTIVEFKSEWVKTPFYELHRKTPNGKFQCYETNWSNKVEFVKTDNGWDLKDRSLYNLE